MQLIIPIALCAYFVAGTATPQGFPPQFISQPQSPLLLTGGTRRQLTPAQQTHILSDIQQHQHRFAAQPQNQLFNPTNKHFGQKNGNIVVEPSLQLPVDSLQLPQQQPHQFFSPQSQSPLVNRYRQQANIPRANELHVQHHTQTNFVPNFVSPQAPQHVAFPQQPLFERNPAVFQRSVANQQGDVQNSFKPSQPFPAAVPSPPAPSSAEQFLQQPQQSIKTLQSQIYQSQFGQVSPQFGQNQIIAPQTPTQSLSPPLNQFPHFQQLTQSQQGPSFAGPPQTQLNSQFFPDIRPDDQRYKELLEKQKIIQKHEQFVQRQQQKHQQKVRQLHEEFVQKQRRIKEQSIVNSKPRTPVASNYFPQPPRSRVVSPYETPVFERAVKNYQQEHPTVPTTTSPTTVAASNGIVRIKSSRSNLKGDISEDELEKLLTNHREKIYSHLKQDADKSSKKAKVKPTKALGREDLLKQLKLALADQPADLGDKNYTTMDLVLPDGQKVQVIRTTDPNLVHGATPLSEDGSIFSQISPQQLIGQQSQQNAVFEQQPLLQQVADSGILPPGSNFEVIKQSADGNLQPVNALPEKKKVTFVYLEEQDDGSYKVQGVKANGEKEAKTKGAEVESIINRIKNGEIQLPPPVTHQNSATSASQRTTTRVTPSSPAPSTIFNQPSYGTQSTYESSSPTTRFIPNATPPTPTFHFVSTASPYSTLGTLASENTIRLTASPSTYFASTTPRSVPTRSAHVTRGISTKYPNLSTTYSDSILSSVSQPASSASTLSQVQASPTASPVEAATAQSELSNILKNNGLHAMAKYLKQSGLDAILNETGPYTVFAPSDKAFKSLLVQLGGPDRAEEKFKGNPRLLSGLLLHHVIPGHFEIASLQDEMTGVSLAGTQLRVNQYNMHDTEWNDVKITTINGAMVLPDKKDILIPQGIAHSVDRVMFPLPVGDILQTLQSDRERRFTHFLRALFSSGLSELLQNKDPASSKTYTVFAPIDAAFGNRTQEEINFMVTDKETAHKLVMRHITAGTLFSTGMRFYQVRDSLLAGNAMTLQKTGGGKIKVNESQIMTTNIPATNGVIHAIDTIL